MFFGRRALSFRIVQSRIGACRFTRRRYGTLRELPADQHTEVANAGDGEALGSLLVPQAVDGLVDSLGDCSRVTVHSEAIHVPDKRCELNRSMQHLLIS
jgi:hypothetical protein